MTSQKSSKNNVNAKDFLRSLKGSIAFPAIALVVLFIAFALPVLKLFLSREFQSEAVHDAVHVFLAPGSMFSYSATALSVGMVLCGILTAVKSLGFVMSKKQTNVYLSIGMKRMTLVLNRIIAGAICLFTAVIIPLTVTYLLNIAYLGYTAHLTSVYLYLVGALTVSAFTGLAIGTASASIAGNYFECALNATAVSLIPFLAVNIFSSMKDAFLKGFVINYNASNILSRLVTPFSFCIDVNAKTTELYMGYGSYNTGRDAVGSLGVALNRGDVTPDKFKVPEELLIDMGLILPLIIWAVVSVALVALGLFLFKRRRMEHAGSLGHFKLSTGLISTAIYAFVSLFAFENMPNPEYMTVGEADRITNQKWFWIIVWLGASLVAYFVAQLILKRKLKATLKSLALYPALVALTAVALVAVDTEYFGTYNRLPETGEIKNVAVSFNDTLFSGYGAYGEDEPEIVGTSEKDIKDIARLFELVKNDEGGKGATLKDALSRAVFYIKDKNGEVIERVFPIYSEKIYLEYMRTVYNTDYFDSILKYYFIDDREAPEEENNGFSSDYFGQADTDYYGEVSYKEAPWTFYDGTYLAETDGEEVFQSYNIEDSVALCKAIYADLSTMTYDEISRNTKKPLCALSMSDYNVLPSDALLSEARQTKWEDFGYWEEEYKNPIMKNMMKAGYDTLYVTPDMKNTVKYLESVGLLSKTTFTGSIKEILYTDSPLEFNEVDTKFLRAHYNTEYVAGYDEGLLTSFDQSWLFSDSGMLDYKFDAMGSDKDATITDYLKKIYVNANHPLISVTDKNKTAEIFSASLPHFAPLSDMGRYVYVIYDNGAMMCLYLPEANVGALK